MENPYNGNNIVMKAHIDISEIEEAAKKIAALNELLEKANSLASELGAQEIKLSVEIES